MAPNYTTPELAEMLLQLIDRGSIVVDDAEYLGQGIHKFYVDRDTLERLAGRNTEG